MFNIIRLLIGSVFLVSSLMLVKRTKTTHKRVLYTVFVFVSIVIVTVTEFLPFENYFITFSSPKKAYEYYCLGRSNVEIVVEGTHSDFVVDRKNEKDTYLIIPKTVDGWKVGIGVDTKRIARKISNGAIISVYQYKNTSDYFITIFDTNGDKFIVADDYNTEFYSLERNNDSIGKKYVTYYAYVPEFGSQYGVLINGKKIVCM